MTLLGFVIGLVLMIVGYCCIRYTDALLRYLGDISELFGAVNASWMSWKLVGVAFMIIGFLIAFGLIQAFFHLTVGQFFDLGGNF